MEDAHAKTVDEVLKHFNTNGDVGLTPDQVKQYQAKYGPNGKSPSSSFSISKQCHLWKLITLLHLLRFNCLIAVEASPKTKATE